MPAYTPKPKTLNFGLFLQVQTPFLLRPASASHLDCQKAVFRCGRHAHLQLGYLLGSTYISVDELSGYGLEAMTLVQPFLV